MLRISVAILVVTAALAAVASAGAAVKDPRVCTTVTPGGASRHAYYCAQAAAVTTTRQAMAAHDHVAKWYYPVFCKPVAGTLLRWSCSTVKGGPYATVAVWFRKLATGWRYQTKLVMAP